MASPPNNQSGWTERTDKMLHIFMTRHDAVFLHLYVSHEGVLLSLSSDMSIEWMPEAFPLTFNNAVDAVLSGKEVKKNFLITRHSSIDVCGIIEFLPEESGAERFYKLTLQKGTDSMNSLTIKLRENELQKIQETFVGFWTC